MRKQRLRYVIKEWDNLVTPRAHERAYQQTYLADLRRTRLAALGRELGGIKLQERRSGKPSNISQQHPADAKEEGAFVAPDLKESFFAFPRAMRMLKQRLRATREELAAWVWIGSEQGGVDAYLNANELEPPERFHYSTCLVDFDYLSPRMAWWFIRKEVIDFEPSGRYITGGALIKRWCKYAEIDPVGFICAKIDESRLCDLHPSTGRTQGGMSGNNEYPPLESGLFAISEIEAIEETDFIPDGADRRAKYPGRLNYDPDLQARANEIAEDLWGKRRRKAFKYEVAKLLAAECDLDEATVGRRIRKQW